MEIVYVDICLRFILMILYLITCLLKIRSLQEQIRAVSNTNPHIQQDIFVVRKNNPGHKKRTRSARRFRERQRDMHLKHWWSKNKKRSRYHTKGPEPIREDPTVKKISRMNCQQLQPCLGNSHISHLLPLFHNKLCIYTALPFLTFGIFCYHLRIHLTESIWLEIGEESDEV